jgi:hypothetical protein
MNPELLTLNFLSVHSVVPVFEVSNHGTRGTHRKINPEL